MIASGFKAKVGAKIHAIDTGRDIAILKTKLKGESQRKRLIFKNFK